MRDRIIYEVKEHWSFRPFHFAKTMKRVNNQGIYTLILFAKNSWMETGETTTSATPGVASAFSSAYQQVDECGSPLLLTRSTVN